MQYYLSLLGFAAIDSLNLLAFAVIAGLWLTSAGRGVAFAPRAARFTGGAFCGIVLLSLISVWVIGNNQESTTCGRWSRSAWSASSSRSWGCGSPPRPRRRASRRR